MAAARSSTATAQALQDAAGRRTADAAPLLELLERQLCPQALAVALEIGDAPAALHHLDRALREPAAAFLAGSGKGFRARLVEIGWKLVAPEAPMPRELPLLVELLHAGSLIVDDIEDGSTHRRGRPALHRAFGVPAALNTGNWLYFWPFERLGELGLHADVELDLRRRMARTLYRGHVGQALDLHLRASTLERSELRPAVAALSQLKTGELTSFAITLGAAAGGAPEEKREAVARFGRAMGIALQMLDDCGGLSGAADPRKRHEDLRLDRATWAWVWAAEHAGPETFRALQARAAAVAGGAAPAEVLAGELARHASGAVAAEPHALLAEALATLEAKLGGHAALEELRGEIARLEASYG